MAIRKLVIDGQKWEWNYGSSRIVIRSPERKRYVVSTIEMTNNTWTYNDIERAHHKGNYFAIHPSNVVNYIRRVILGQDVPSPKFGDFERQYSADEYAAHRAEFTAMVAQHNIDHPENFIQWPPIEEPA